ncbi:RNA-binding S4 domain-containing protein [Pleionea sp. CnH1-48]|uniref:RNA-binding S4 domain-containing protein n=1 Tax=Pleionea sp. CnH1-48 TaxID=2954494 RepID=UPI002096FBDA|nr:S4 domain-containing protein [Pleionea sp. CnH1-48]MCO7225206.1 S4 domain-containing protein [Pleionea sp. CnH1-48]
MTIDEKVRLDKWLWAARFFKTRSLARDAIEGGKVHYEGKRIKPGKIVQTGATLNIRQGVEEKVVTVLAISSKRGPATVAQTLYQETAESIAQREKAREQRQAEGVIHHPRPDKKQRRQIHRFIRKQGSS